jgi:hypothetical protein
MQILSASNSFDCVYTPLHHFCDICQEVLFLERARSENLRGKK